MTGADEVSSLDKPAQLNIRAPRPATLTWTQREVEKDHSTDYSTEEANGTGSGPTSPVSPIIPEALRTPNTADRHKYSCKYPASPVATSQLPRLHSPASQIFERSVQEDMLPFQTSPSIPAHIRTDNYIPPVLEASSAAITNEQLDPDSVEIVTHIIHQHAAAGATGVSSTEESLASSGIFDHGGTLDFDEASSTHGALDSPDVRRLSFISFADVVNAENAETGEFSFRGSPSPMQSPNSSHGLGTSPPTSPETSFQGLDKSPSLGAHGTAGSFSMTQSPVSSSFGGELNVETMRQALKKTGSRDGVTSQIASTSNNDNSLDRSFLLSRP
ncbi:hypothetical protein N7495_009821 [Penicillium taxi]|uniref:uncharacterized protein n=1 Tax=Penicillium taxi TaxID=168475 RepID=UPI0025459E00|nr:uncharacterized protein N7495_009821 [Penicillium taxi]KAJ5885311.1 hypothetical protein N7495_009821 [Penicillium taxi]